MGKGTVEIPGENAVEVEVTPEGVRLYKSGNSIVASPDSVPALQADGWLAFDADLDSLAKDVGIWAGTVEGAAFDFARVITADGVIDTGEQAQLAAVATAVRELNQAYERLYNAAFIMHPVTQAAGEEGADDGN